MCVALSGIVYMLKYNVHVYTCTYICTIIVHVSSTIYIHVHVVTGTVLNASNVICFSLYVYMCFDVLILSVVVIYTLVMRKLPC